MTLMVVAPTGMMTRTWMTRVPAGPRSPAIGAWSEATGC